MNGLFQNMNAILAHHQPNFYKPGSLELTTNKGLFGWYGAVEHGGFYAAGYAQLPQ